MRNYFKKFSIMFVMALILMLGVSVTAFAIDDGVIGTSNLNNTTSNSAVVGEQLTAPEIGWKRYDDTDNNITYNGKWSKSTTSIAYNSSLQYTSIYGNTIQFKFYGTRFRLIDTRFPDRDPNPIISIDGSAIADTNNFKGNIQYQTLVLQKTGLSLGFHTVSITKDINDSSSICLDAIDIDYNGYLIDPNESITLDKSTMDLAVGYSQQLTATTTPAGAQVTWKSSDSSVATVDSAGKVIGVKEGTCTITATTANGLTATCAVTVIPKGTVPNPKPTDTEYITNIAHAKGTNTNNPGGDVTIIFHGSSDTTLSLVKTADVKDVWVGDNFTYTLVITNTGTKTAKAVVVNDPAPNHIDFNVSGVTTTQGTVDSSSTSKNIIVNVGDILPGGTVIIKIPSTVIA